MLCFISFIALSALTATLSLTIENAVPASVRRSIENSYIVKLKDGTNTTSHVESLPFPFSVKDPNSPITHWWPDGFKGYSGVFEGAALDAILASPHVEYVEKNGLATHSISQTRAPWNLQAISTRRPVDRQQYWNKLVYTYSYTEPSGDGVDLYIVDTGVYIGHYEFEDRATNGWIAPGLEPGDDFGHGTYMAALAAGKTYGVAKNANIISVKVGDKNIIRHNDIIGGLDWIGANIRSTGKPSVVCMAINAPPSSGINHAASSVISNGVALVLSAGNAAEDARNTSPTVLMEAIVVGASDITNTMWSQSNFGPAVDVFAPGVGVTSAWIGTRRNTRTYSGSSGSAAHVAGVAADILSKNPGMSPEAIRSRILALATKNVLSGVPPGTENLLLFKR